MTTSSLGRAQQMRTLPSTGGSSGFGLVSDRAGDQAGFAVVAHAGAAGPAHGHVAGFGQFEKALVTFPLQRRETAACEPAHWSVSCGPFRLMWRPNRGADGTACERGTTRKDLGVDPIWRHSPGNKVS